MSRIKIDLITMDAVPNYGSVLQAFATQKFFENKDCDVTIIQYFRQDVRYENLLRSWSGKNPIKAVVMFPTIRRWIKVFGSFRNQYLNLSKERYTTDEDFVRYPLDADAYCTGSDQVWNSKWNNGIIKPLYLSFVPNEKFKFAFSASFGQSKLSAEEVALTQDLIDAYKYISVREDSGVRILHDQYNYNSACHLIDPTLALRPEEWRCYASSSKIKAPYILVYNLNRSRDFDEYAVSLAKRTGLKLVRFCTRYDQFYRPGRCILVPDVFEFVTLIDNAKYVLTDSFHATAFSMNLGTEPICVYPNEFGGRIKSFLTLTNSLHRHINDYNDYDVVNRHVDFTEVNMILERERKRLSDWLDIVLKCIIDEKEKRS